MPPPLAYRVCLPGPDKNSLFPWFHDRINIQRIFYRHYIHFQVYCRHYIDSHIRDGFSLKDLTRFFSLNSEGMSPRQVILISYVQGKLCCDITRSPILCLFVCQKETINTRLTEFVWKPVGHHQVFLESKYQLSQEGGSILWLTLI